MLPSKLTILTYHRVIEQPDPLRPDEADLTTFDAHMRTLARLFRVLPLGEAIDRMQSGSLPRRAVAITFDDGYADNCELALPVLQRLGLPATFYIATGFLDGGRMWNDTVIEAVRRLRRATLSLPEFGIDGFALDKIEQRQQAADTLIRMWKYLPTEERRRRTELLQGMIDEEMPGDLMMSAEQVRTLHRRGMEVGGHTVNHPILARVDDVTAMTEIAAGKQQLEAITGAPVKLFAYPNGRPGEDYVDRHVTMVREAGFYAAVSTRSGTVTPADDIYQLPRFAPWDKSGARLAVRLIQQRL
jgi:peptidoglycan/xylan/chitin deacetylase (PgdA/CDA1 family)